MNIVYVSSYVPRKCGIATYTRDLSEEILTQGQKIAVFAMENDIPPSVRLKGPVISKIKQDSLEEYKKAARTINAGNFDLVHIQHEFGLFGGRDGKYILEFARLLSIPVVVSVCASFFLFDPVFEGSRIFNENISVGCVGDFESFVKDEVRDDCIV